MPAEPLTAETLSAWADEAASLRERLHPTLSQLVERWRDELDALLTLCLAQPTSWVALCDVGPEQLGQARWIQLAALMLLQERCPGLRVGTLQHPREPLLAWTSRGLISWLQRRSPRAASAQDVAAWAARLGEPAYAGWSVLTLGERLDAQASPTQLVLQVPAQAQQPARVSLWAGQEFLGRATLERDSLALAWPLFDRPIAKTQAPDPDQALTPLGVEPDRGRVLALADSSATPMLWALEPRGQDAPRAWALPQGAQVVAAGWHRRSPVAALSLEQQLWLWRPQQPLAAMGVELPWPQGRPHRLLVGRGADAHLGLRWGVSAGKVAYTGWLRPDRVPPERQRPEPEPARTRALLVAQGALWSLGEPARDASMEADTQLIARGGMIARWSEQLHEETSLGPEQLVSLALGRLGQAPRHRQPATLLTHQAQSQRLATLVRDRRGRLKLLVPLWRQWFWSGLADATHWQDRHIFACPPGMTPLGAMLNAACDDELGLIAREDATGDLWIVGRRFARQLLVGPTQPEHLWVDLARRRVILWQRDQPRVVEV